VALQIDADLPTALVPLAWLIGDWVGVGVVGYPTMDTDLHFGQEVSFSHDGRPVLAYHSRTWLLDADGQRVRPLATETGFWRIRPAEPSPAAATDPAVQAESAHELEVLLTHPTGITEIYLGQVRGPRVELQTDLVARTESAKEYSAAARLYGLVESDLMWVMEMAAMGRPLTAHASARLHRA
jgi:hypothetical protein